MRVQAHNCSHQGLGGGSFLKKRLSGASSTSSQPRKGWAYSMCHGHPPCPGSSARNHIHALGVQGLLTCP